MTWKRSKTICLSTSGPRRPDGELPQVRGHHLDAGALVLCQPGIIAVKTLLRAIFSDGLPVSSFKSQSRVSYVYPLAAVFSSTSLRRTTCVSVSGYAILC
jgi:hypothetical protein